MDMPPAVKGLEAERRQNSRVTLHLLQSNAPAIPGDQSRVKLSRWVSR
jgi:hypothetical protein